MLNARFQERLLSNNKKKYTSDKKLTASPINLNKEREKSPSVDNSLCPLRANRKITEVNNKLYLTERKSISKTKTFLNSNHKSNSNENVHNKSLSKEKKTPMSHHKVNLLQSYYAMKNPNKSKNSFSDKIRFSISNEKNDQKNIKKITSTSRERKSVNNIIASENIMKNNYLTNNSHLSNNINKNENSFNKSVEKFKNSNSSLNASKKISKIKSPSFSINSNTASKNFNSKSPSQRTKVNSKSPKRENPKKLIISNSPIIKRKSPSPLRSNKENVKNVSLLKKYEELKSKDKSPGVFKVIKKRESEKKSDKKNSLLINNSNNNSLNLNKSEDVSFNDYNKHLDENVSLSKKLFTTNIDESESGRESKSNSISIKTSSSHNSYSENNEGSKTYSNNKFNKGNLLKKDSNEMKRDSRDINRKTNPTFREMNTSPLVTKKNFKRTENNSTSKNSSKVTVSKKNENTTITQSNTSLLKTFLDNRNQLNSNSPDSRISKSTFDSNLPSKSNSNSNSKHSIPIHRAIKKIHHISKIGYAIDSTKKHNQDSYFICDNNFTNELNSVFLSVFDGHGIFGHEVSRFLKKTLPLILSNEIKHRIKAGDKDTNKIKQIVEKVFISVNYLLMNDHTIDSNFSGSTCVSVLYSPEKLLCANVGDSRAVLGRFVNSKWSSIDLSRDHKPCEKDEASRIIRKGGRIEPYKDEEGGFYGPDRIWLKDDDIPGLAMSRSFGDKVAALVGVVCDPEIMEWKLTMDDKFLIVASDGLWEFLDSDEDFYLKDDIEGALEFLLKESSSRWLREEECVDDTTIIVVFFD